MADPSLDVRIRADIRNFERGLKDARSEVATFGRTTDTTSKGAMSSFANMGSFAKGALGGAVVLGAAKAGGAMIQFGKDSVMAASDLDEALNAATVAFKDDAAEATQWAQDLDSAFGLTRTEALNAAAQLRLVTQDSSLTAKQITDLAERAADLGSVFNVAGDEVSQAIKSGLVGESEPMRRFGVLLSEGSIQAEAYASGIAELGSELTPAQKQAAAYNLIMEKTAFAQDDATKTADTAAGQLRKMRAEASRASEALGQALLPAFTKIVGVITDTGIPAFMWLGEVVGEGIADAAGFFIGAIADIVSAVDKGGSFINKMVPFFDPVPGADGIVDDLRNIEANLHNMQSSFGDTAMVAQETATTTGELTGALDELIPAQEESAVTAEEVADATTAVADARRDARDATRAITDAEFDLADAHVAVDDAVRGLAEAQEEYNDLLATGGVDMEKVRDAQEDILDVQEKLAGATRDVAEAHKEVQEALKPADVKDLAKAERDLEGAKDDVTRAGLDLSDAEQDLIDLRADGETTADELTRAELRVRDAERDLADAQDRVIDRQSHLNELKKIGTTDSDTYKTAEENLKTAQDGLATVTGEFTTAQQALNEAQAVAPSFADDLAEAQRGVRDAETEVRDRTWEAEGATLDLRDAQLDATTKAGELRTAQGELGALQGPLRVELGKTETSIRDIGLAMSEVGGGDWSIPAPTPPPPVSFVPWNFMGPLGPNQFRLPAPGEMLSPLAVMHDGGMVPGSRGAEVPILAQAGEMIIPLGGGGGSAPAGGMTVIQLVLDGKVITEVAHDGLLSKQRRSGNLGFVAA